LLLKVDDLLAFLMGQLDGLENDGFGFFFRSALHHDHGLAAGGHDQIKGAVFHLLESGVDDQFAVDPGGHGSADLATLGEVAFELPTDGLEFGRAEARDRDVLAAHPSIAHVVTVNMSVEPRSIRSRNQTVIQMTCEATRLGVAWEFCAVR
jgi:hypothetical protein